jgi:hypothetical protein
MQAQPPKVDAREDRDIEGDKPKVGPVSLGTEERRRGARPHTTMVLWEPRRYAATLDSLFHTRFNRTCSVPSRVFGGPSS